jgi:hypothetical protein
MIKLGEVQIGQHQTHATGGGEFQQLCAIGRGRDAMTLAGQHSTRYFTHGAVVMHD